MNIEKLAKEAGLKGYQEQAPGIDGAVGNWNEIAKFAELVVAHEREECAKIADKNADRCNKDSLAYMLLSSNASAIRARSKA